MPRSAVHSATCAAYEGVSTAALGDNAPIVCTRRAVFPVPNGRWLRPIRSNAASAAPAANGPALYVVTTRSPAATPDAA